MENKYPFPLPTVPFQAKDDEYRQQSNQLSGKLYSDFFAFPVEEARHALETTSSQKWEKMGREQALKTFHAAAERVPAYKDFLRKHKVNHDKIYAFEQFQQIPPIDKESYLRSYELKDLCWDGKINSDIFSMSSGTTGEPFLWPRSVNLEMETSYIFELVMSTFFQLAARKTLFVNCFSMGAYTGGVFVSSATLRVLEKGYDAAMVTPGIIMKDIISVVKKLISQHEQLIFSGYPPFLKDIIEEGVRQGINWTDVKIIFLTSSEGFPEGWRQSVAETAGIESQYTDFLSYYACADAAILGMETPESIMIRKLWEENRDTLQRICGQNRLPSLMQYIPTLRYFESVDNELVFTSASGQIPLVRYNIHDQGGIFTYEEMHKILRPEKINMHEQSGITSWKLPYLYLFGRSDHTVTLYGLNIYPEHIKTALLNEVISDEVSGKFQMSTEYNQQTNDQYLLIRVELTVGLKETNELREKIQEIIIDTLKEVNAEYRKLSASIGNKAIPGVQIYRWGDDRYFTIGTKQQWKS